MQTIIVCSSIAVIVVILLIILLVRSHTHFTFRQYPVKKIIAIYDYHKELKLCVLEGIEKDDGFWNLKVSYADCDGRIPCRVETNSAGYPIYAYIYLPLSSDKISQLSKSFNIYFLHQHNLSSKEAKTAGLIFQHLNSDQPELTIDLVHATHAEIVLQAMLEKQEKNSSNECAELSFQL